MTLTKQSRTRNGEVVTVSVDIDVHALAQIIADKAALNRTGKARFHAGDIRAKVVK